MTAVVGEHPPSRPGRPTLADPDLGRDVLTTSVVTPEAVLLEFRSAGIGSRVLAKMVDLAILGALALGSMFAIGVVVAVAGDTIGIIAVTVLVFALLFVYPCTEAWLGGATPGKRALGLEVITVEGGPVRLRHAAIRATIGLVEFLLPPGGLLALASALLTRRSQRIGDLAAGTLVVRKVRTSVPVVVFPPPAGYQAARFAETCDVSRLSPEWYALLRDYWLRWPTLDENVRWLRLRELTSDVEQRIGVPRPPQLSEDDYLSAVLFASQRADWAALGRTAPVAATSTGRPPDAPVSAEALRHAPPPIVPPSPAGPPSQTGG